VALRLFREHGFDHATMRDIARQSGLSLGAAYYYFNSKDSIVLAYYAQVQEAHEQRARAAFASTDDLRARIGAAFHTKLELLKDDQRVLRALFRSVGDPDIPLSMFAKDTAEVRSRSMALFTESVSGIGLPEEMVPVLGRALWALHLGALLYFLQDRSPGQSRTRALVDEVLDVLSQVIPLAASPALEGARSHLIDLFTKAQLLPRLIASAESL
jgi:AcrR family transcriptional regulator